MRSEWRATLRRGRDGRQRVRGAGRDRARPSSGRWRAALSHGGGSLNEPGGLRLPTPLPVPLKPGVPESVQLQLPPPQVELLERHAYPQRPLDRSQGALFASPWPLGLQRPLLSIKRPWPPPPRLCALVLSPPGTQATQPGQEWRWCTVTRCQPYHAQRRHGSHATVHPGGAVSSAWNPQVLCEPSQNGFLAECPQRHRA